MGDDSGSFRFIGFFNQTNQPHHDHPFPDLELDEADMFYSSTVDSHYNYHYDSPPSVDHNRYAVTHQRFGLSSFLADHDTEPMVTAPQPVPCFGYSNRAGTHQSAPQAVPTWHSRTGDAWDSEERRDGNEVFGQETEIVPPHVMVARSHMSTPFSVLEGAGRTLKGRDLRRVRNAVLQKTGFLDL